tara:strand:+ start:146 stop:712 length:567 start_codon:yes stop_codon:yes gene_type:complete
VKKLAIFGSGEGSNAENICNYFKNSSYVKIVFICTNNKSSNIVTRAKKLKIPVVFTTKKKLLSFSSLQKTLKEYCVDYIVLAGFLLKVPSKMIDCYPRKIINIHPSLLPKFGGKGMYGNNVHEAVLKNKESKSGITIHFVNKNYDEGEIIFQKTCDISFFETVHSLRKKIGLLEFGFFPKIIENVLLE